jgi:hypothetical protein
MHVSMQALATGSSLATFIYNVMQIQILETAPCSHGEGWDRPIPHIFCYVVLFNTLTNNNDKHFLMNAMRL